MAFQTITQDGTFTRSTKNIINSNFASINNPDVWVRPQYGNNNSADGTYDKPYATMAGLARIIKSGMVIGLQGVLLEEYSTPNINDVTITGYNSGQPRQATTSTVPNGGGATWLSPSGGTGHLLTINGQGWVIKNLLFNNSATSGADILLTNTGDGPALANAEHTQVLGCVFTGAKYGIRATGLPNFVTLIGNRFFGFGDAGDISLSSITGAGTGTSYSWTITYNDFRSSALHISGAFSAAQIAENHFAYIDGGVTTTQQIVTTGGLNNSIHNNYFDVPPDVNGISAMFALGTNDRWYANEFSKAITTTIFSFSAPPVS